MLHWEKQVKYQLTVQWQPSSRLWGVADTEAIKWLDFQSRCICLREYSSQPYWQAKFPGGGGFTPSEILDHGQFFFKIEPGSGTYYILWYTIITKLIAFIISQARYKYLLKCAYFDWLYNLLNYSSGPSICLLATRQQVLQQESYNAIWPPNQAGDMG